MSRLVTLAVLTLVLGACGVDTDGTARSAAQASAHSPDSNSARSASGQRTKKDVKKRGKKHASAGKSRGKKSGVKRHAVLDVVDGDTVKVAYRGGESVRVIGIDTPETVHPSVPDECGGSAASRKAKKLLKGERVALVFDRSQGRRDAYGRLLAYVQAPGVGDFGLEMIRRGHAAEYTYDTPYRHRGKYQRAESRARSADRGLWGKCGGPDVPKKQKRKPGQRSGSGGGCEPGYDPCVPRYPPDRDCADVDGPVRVSGNDPHGLDADGDGVACES